jgi:hypothetical protein
MEQRATWETDSLSDSEATPCLSGRPNTTPEFLRARHWFLSEAKGINPHSCIIIVFKIPSYYSYLSGVVKSLHTQSVQFCLNLLSVPFVPQGRTFYPILVSP